MISSAHQLQLHLSDAAEVLGAHSVSMHDSRTVCSAPEVAAEVPAGGGLVCREDLCATAEEFAAGVLQQLRPRC